VQKIETSYSTLLSQNEAFIRFNMDVLQRGDIQSRFAAYSTGMQSGFLSINDIRRLEDMRPVDGGDENRVPLANVNVGAANVVETERRVLMAQRLIMSGFDPAGALAVVGLPAITHTGLPSVQLQPIAQIDEIDPQAAYPVRDIDPAEFADAVSNAIRSMKAPVVNVNLPESKAKIRKIERDDAGNISKITEE
jgi:hypothetical protein